MDNYCLSFTTESTAQAELLSAVLSDFPFYSFVEAEQKLEAYIKADDWTKDLQETLSKIDLINPLDYTIEFLPYTNWNAVWESNFQAIEVPGFCGVRASFHPPFKDVKHEILIDPEMAFGTGHHETTFMMMQLMESMDFNDKKVFDYGCGTGILAILADKMGANQIEAVDIEQPAYENTINNAQKNDASNIKAIHGTLENVSREDFQIILANINRNVILSSLSTLNLKLTEGGLILLSGILQVDFEKVKLAAEQEGFIYNKHLSKGDWVAIMMQK
ncbi:MAG: 50S ribosomal protein L11 methyltransferase [Bacteroidota bacterium]